MDPLQFTDLINLLSSGQQVVVDAISFTCGILTALIVATAWKV